MEKNGLKTKLLLKIIKNIVANYKFIRITAKFKTGIVKIEQSLGAIEQGFGTTK